MTLPCCTARKSGSANGGRSRDARAARARRLGMTLVPIALLIVWELGARRLNQPWLLPTFSATAARLAHPFTDLYGCGSLAAQAYVSLVRVLIGFALAALIGVPLGILMGASGAVRGLVEPLVELLRPLCPIAWLPFAIAVFKLHSLPRLVGVAHSGTVLDQVQQGMVFVLFWGAFFPIVTNTLDGVAGVRTDYLRLARTLGATRRQLFHRVYLPAALPMILTGLRQGIGTAWFVIVAAEMLPGSDSGVGYLLMYAADKCDMDVVVMAMLTIAAAGAALNFGMRGLMRTCVAWYGKER